MGAMGVVVSVHVFPQDPLQMALVQGDDMVQGFLPQYPDQALADPVLPGRPYACPHGFDARVRQEALQAARREGGIVVVEQVFRLPAERRGFPDLLDHPYIGRVRGDAEMHRLLHCRAACP